MWVPTGVTEAMSPADWLFPDPWAHSTTSQGTAGPSSGSQGDKGKDTIRVKAMAYLVSHLLSELTQEDCACSTPRHTTTPYPHSQQRVLSSVNQWCQVSSVSVSLAFRAIYVPLTFSVL